MILCFFSWFCLGGLGGWVLVVFCWVWGLVVLFIFSQEGGCKMRRVFFHVIWANLGLHLFFFPINCADLGPTPAFLMSVQGTFLIPRTHKFPRPVPEAEMHAFGQGIHLGCAEAKIKSDKAPS